MQYILMTRANQGCPHCSYNLRHLWFLEQLRTSSLASANFPKKSPWRWIKTQLAEVFHWKKTPENEHGWMENHENKHIAILFFFGWYIDIDISTNLAFLFMMKIRMTQLSRIHGLICLFSCCIMCISWLSSQGTRRHLFDMLAPQRCLWDDTWGVP